jgi:hypothetical protein
MIGRQRLAVNQRNAQHSARRFPARCFPHAVGRISAGHPKNTTPRVSMHVSPTHETWHSFGMLVADQGTNSLYILF